MTDVYSPEFTNALRQAGEELGLADYYQPCVRPLFGISMQQWPMCCGGRCQPCAQLLIAVAQRTGELLKIDMAQLGK